MSPPCASICAAEGWVAIWFNRLKWGCRSCCGFCLVWVRGGSFGIVWGGGSCVSADWMI